MSFDVGTDYTDSKKRWCTKANVGIQVFVYTLCPNTLGKNFVKLAAETHLLTVFLNIRWSMAFLSSFLAFFEEWTT